MPDTTMTIIAADVIIVGNLILPFLKFAFLFSQPMDLFHSSYFHLMFLLLLTLKVIL